MATEDRIKGSNIPVLEVEKLIISKDGRGFTFSQGSRLSRDWAGLSWSGGAVGGKKFLVAASSSGWLKIHVISGSTYGPTGASYYIPLFSTRTTYNSELDVIFILHGKGSQAFFTNSFEEKRRKGLEDRDKLTPTEQTTYGISGSKGGGRTNPDTYTIEQFPFPVDPSIRKAKKIDVRKVDPKIGEMSD